MTAMTAAIEANAKRQESLALSMAVTSSGPNVAPSP